MSRTLPTNALTGNRYRGVNVVALWAAAEVSGFTAGLWATYNQWKLRGAQVRAGEKGSIVVFYKPTAWEAVDKQSGETETKTVLLARAS
ncbi:MAG: ArdC-like ssDNA-binding domain-containing protein, partial [Terriglobia bacterium]